MVPSVLPLSHSASSPICYLHSCLCVFFVAIIVTHLEFFRLFGFTFSFTKNLLSHCIDLVQLCLVTLLFHFPLLCRSSRVLRLSLCLSSLVRSLFFPLKFMDSFKFYVAICCAFGFLC